MAFQPTTKTEFLERWRSLFPASYTVPIEEENGGFGFDVPSQQAAQFARVSEAVAVSFQAYYLRHHSTEVRPPAAGALASIGIVQVSRVGSAIGPITLDAGTILTVRVRDSLGALIEGVRFALASSVTIESGSLGPIAAPVIAERVGYQGNVEAGSITAFADLGRATVPNATFESGNVIRDSGIADRFTPAMVGRYVRIVGGANGGTFPRRVLSCTQEPTTSWVVVDGPALTFPASSTQVEVEEFADLGLVVEQTEPTTGGRHGWLDAIGRDRGIARAPAESDEAYRLRLGALADVVSPGAVRRAAQRVLDPLGIPFAIKETRDPNTMIGFVWDYHAWDYGSPQDGIIFAPPVRFFLVLVGLGNQGEFGFPYDQPYPSNAWGAPGDALNFFDGFPVEYMSAMVALFAEIERARAAGVGWLLLRDPSL